MGRTHVDQTFDESGTLISTVSRPFTLREELYKEAEEQLERLFLHYVQGVLPTDSPDEVLAKIRDNMKQIVRSKAAQVPALPVTRAQFVEAVADLTVELCAGLLWAVLYVRGGEALRT